MKFWLFALFAIWGVVNVLLGFCMGERYVIKEVKREAMIKDRARQFREEYKRTFGKEKKDEPDIERD